MRNIFFLICILLSAGTLSFFSPFLDIDFSSSNAGGTTYAVEIAKYKYPVYTDYFDNLDDVIELDAENGEYHYISGITTSRADAEEISAEIRELGYKEARIIDLNKEFSAEELADVLSGDIQKQDQKKKTVTEKKKAAELAISKLNNVGNAYFYTIKLKESKEMESAADFAPLKPKAHKQSGAYHYLLGRFEDVNTAQKYMKENVLSNYKNAEVVVMNKGQLAKKNVPASEEAQYDMGRKMRGKEYLAYYYELPELKFVSTPLYQIELGPYRDKKIAEEAVQKLKDLGFEKAKIQAPIKTKESQVKRDPSAAKHFTIQVFAGKSSLKTTRFKFEVNRTYDQKDGLYRYFYGDYDDYWVCRRDLRKVRESGYQDAFIVKL